MLWVRVGRRGLEVVKRAELGAGLLEANPWAPWLLVACVSNRKGKIHRKAMQRVEATCARPAELCLWSCCVLDGTRVVGCWRLLPPSPCCCIAHAVVRSKQVLC